MSGKRIRTGTVRYRVSAWHGHRTSQFNVIDNQSNRIIETTVLVSKALHIAALLNSNPLPPTVAHHRHD